MSDFQKALRRFHIALICFGIALVFNIAVALIRLVSP